jgi:hypothetical protein
LRSLRFALVSPGTGLYWEGAVTGHINQVILTDFSFVTRTKVYAIVENLR